MTQSASQSLSTTGISTGSTTYCTSCGAHLTCERGTDPDKADELGGFKETYSCESCDRTGTFTYQYETRQRSYTGICAGEHKWG